MMIESNILTTEESHDEFYWDIFTKELNDYVQLELKGEDVEARYPEWAFHIKTSIECRDLYLHELHQESLAQVDAAVLHQVEQLLHRPQAITAINPASEWIEQVIEGGRAWLEAGTQIWRQVEFSLANLHIETAGKPAMAGLMSAESGQPNVVQGTFEVAPRDSNFELSIEVSADPATSDPDLCQAQITLTLLERFGDYSGVDLFLIWGDLTQQATTDAFGQALFSGLPAAQVPTMNLIVAFPENESD